MKLLIIIYCKFIYNGGLVLIGSQSAPQVSFISFINGTWLAAWDHTGMTQPLSFCQAALISPPLLDSPEEKGVCAQLKEQTDGWLSNDTKNTTNPGFWHTESDGELWGQIKAGHMGSGFWLSSPPHQPPLLFFFFKLLLSLNKTWAHVFVFVFLLISPNLKMRNNNHKIPVLWQSTLGELICGLLLFTDTSQKKRLGNGTAVLEWATWRKSVIGGFLIRGDAMWLAVVFWSHCFDTVKMPCPRLGSVPAGYIINEPNTRGCGPGRLLL